ncbi:hypothetical protein DFH09DRAFT_1108002 [Mycena vulgaris]|nr:hypothetical protein DFH09DRAFT_1108002 [Mycena vulgaris]
MLAIQGHVVAWNGGVAEPERLSASASPSNPYAPSTANPEYPRRVRGVAHACVRCQSGMRLQRAVEARSQGTAGLAADITRTGETGPNGGARMASVQGDAREDGKPEWELKARSTRPREASPSRVGGAAGDGSARRELRTLHYVSRRASARGRWAAGLRRASGWWDGDEGRGGEEIELIEGRRRPGARRLGSAPRLGLRDIENGLRRICMTFVITAWEAASRRRLLTWCATGAGLRPEAVAGAASGSACHAMRRAPHETGPRTAGHPPMRAKSNRVWRLSARRGRRTHRTPGPAVGDAEPRMAMRRRTALRLRRDERWVHGASGRKETGAGADCEDPQANVNVDSASLMRGSAQHCGEFVESACGRDPDAMSEDIYGACGEENKRTVCPTDYPSELNEPTVGEND